MGLIEEKREFIFEDEHNEQISISSGADNSLLIEVNDDSSIIIEFLPQDAVVFANKILDLCGEVAITRSDWDAK